jgi:RNA polymerase sigma factor (sigma-70 family)
MLSMEDAALLQEYARTDSEIAFAALVERHIALVYSAAWRQVRDRQLAEDVTQVVFLILARKAGQLTRHPGLSGWLLKTTRYAASAQIRASSRRAQREQEAFMQSSWNDPALLGQNSAETDASWMQMESLLDEAMASLGEKDRTVLVLRYFENKPLRKIAVTLQMGEAATQKRVARALEKLRARFVKRGVTLSSEVIAESMAANSMQSVPPSLAMLVTAAAKGTAGGPILGLMKGALKLMAWAKAKTAIFVGVGALLIGVTTTVIMTGGESDCEYQGTLTTIYPMIPAGQPTNHFTFRLLSKPPDWELFLTSSNVNYEVFSSLKQTFEVYLFSNNPPAGPLNTCEIEIAPGSRPMFDRGAVHVWLALLSSGAYINMRPAMPDPGLAMMQPPSLIYQISDMEGDASPRQISWTNKLNWTNELRSRNYTEFHWLASTNTSTGFNFPTESQMTTYIITSNGDWKTATFSDLIVDRVMPLKENLVLVPKILGRNVVYDYRLCDFSKLDGLTAMKYYNLQDGDGLEKNTEAILRQQEQLARLTPAVRHRLELEKRSHRKWIWLYATLAICIIAIMARLMKREHGN